MADSIREALTAAIDEAEKPTEQKTEIAALAPESPGADEANVDAAEADAGEGAGNSAEAAEAPPHKEGDAPVAPAAPAAPVAEVNAPASWSAAEKAEWATVPKSARDAIVRREGEMNRALQASATARRRVEAFDQIAHPYKPLLDSYGVGLEQVIPSLLATRAALEIGTPQQKAQLVANLCADFDLDIDSLDDALSARYRGGKPAPRYGGGPPQMADLRNHPQLSGLFQLADAVTQQRQAQAAEAVSAIQSLPHYAEVRLTVADFVDKAKAAGKPIDLPRFYGLACQLHGLEAPAASGPVSASEAASILARSRKAAASVGGAPKPAPPRKPGEGTLREELEANIAAAR